jgi:hypothetical protein
LHGLLRRFVADHDPSDHGRASQDHEGDYAGSGP